MSGAGGGVRGSTEVRGKEGAPWGGEGVKGALKKEPKKPKKAKVKLGKEAGGEGGAAEEAASEPQEQRRGKGREVLLARIKNKGWIRPVAPAAQ